MKLRKLHALLAKEERFWEWLKTLHYLKNKPLNDTKLRLKFNGRPNS